MEYFIRLFLWGYYLSKFCESMICSIVVLWSMLMFGGGWSTMLAVVVMVLESFIESLLHLVTMLVMSVKHMRLNSFFVSIKSFYCWVSLLYLFFQGVRCEGCFEDYSFFCDKYIHIVFHWFGLRVLV